MAASVAMIVLMTLVAVMNNGCHCGGESRIGVAKGQIAIFQL
jgi:hypothetical protein